MLSVMTNRLATLSRRRFVRDVASVGLGVAAAQAISLATMPILARVYGPTAFGILGSFTAVVVMLTPWATLSYSNAIVLASSEKEAAAIIGLATGISLVTAAAMTAAIIVFGDLLSGLLHLGDNRYLLFGIPVSIVAIGALANAMQLAIRQGLFRQRSQALVESTLIAASARLCLGMINPVAPALIAIYVIAPAVNLAMLARRLKPRIAFAPGDVFDAGAAVSAAKKYRDFPCYRLPQSVLNTAALGLPTLALGYAFGPASAGQFSLVLLVLSAPALLLATSVGDVFFGKISRKIESGDSDIHGLLARTTIGLLAGSLIPFGIVVLFGPDIFILLFGGAWAKAGVYGQWIAAWLMTTVVNRPSVAAMPALRMQKQLLANEILVTGARVAALAAGILWAKDDVTTVALFCVAGMIGNLGLIGMVATRTGRGSSC